MFFRPPGPTPKQTFLHTFVDRWFPDYHAQRLDDGRPIPEFVVCDFNEFNTCGNVRSRSATMECTGCADQVVMCLRCKRRGWCPSCMQFRQMDRADFLLRQVIGNTPVRQWVLTLPPPLRIGLAFRPDLVTKVLKRYLDAIFRLIIRLAKELLRQLKRDKPFEMRPGSITGIQRFSTDLTLNLHLHSAVTDGVFIKLTPDDPATFLQVRPPTRAEIADVAWKTCQWARRLLIRANAWRDVHDVSPTKLRTICGYLSLGTATPHLVRYCAVAARKETDDAVRRDGVYAFNLHVGKPIAGGDHKNLRRLLEYILSPPFTDRQLRPDPKHDDHILIDLKRPMLDGTQVLRLTKDQFFDRLVWITPRPRANLLRFHGVYASNYKFRDEVVPACPPPPPPQHDPSQTRADCEAWGELVANSYPNDIMRCRKCGGRMKLIALRSDRITYDRRSGIPPPEDSAE